MHRCRMNRLLKNRQAKDWIRQNDTRLRTRITILCAAPAGRAALCDCRATNCGAGRAQPRLSLSESNAKDRGSDSAPRPDCSGVRRCGETGRKELKFTPLLSDCRPALQFAER